MILREIETELSTPQGVGFDRLASSPVPAREGKIKLPQVLLALMAILGFSAEARAHDPGLSVAEVEVRDAVIEITTAFAPSDVQPLLPARVRPSGPWTPTGFEAEKPVLLELATALWEVHAGGEVLVPRDPRVELTEKSDSLTFRLTFPRPANESVLVFRALKLDALPPGHREYFRANGERGSLVEKLLSAKNPAVEFNVVPMASAGATPDRPSFGGFIKLGVEHIWRGYDHLLFLFGLLIVCRTFKSIVGIVTCFTIAHSLTLALATLNLVNLPSRLVEPMIAASIVFVGVENLVRRGEEPKRRWALTFIFGLIHGFGFASVLRELGVGQDGRGLLAPLFTFNLGVEVGQVAVAAAVLPIVWWLRKNKTFLRRGVPALSGLIAAAGLYWLLERTLFT